VAREGAVEATPSGVSALHEAKVRAELGAADAVAPGSDAVAGTGSLTPAVVVVKGVPGEADRSSGIALSGPDGDAVGKALSALGVDGPVYALCSRAAQGVDPAAAARRLRLVIEALDPALVIALDGTGASDVSAAYAVPAIAFGEPVRVGGRTVLAVDDLERSFTDGRKAEVWQQFRGLLGVESPAR